MTVKQSCYKLAQLIKLAAQDMLNDNLKTYCKVNCMLGDCAFENCPQCPNVIAIEYQAGYRSIVIGDIHGENGFVRLYSEQSSCKSGKEVWKYRCFPPTKDIAMMLEKLYYGDYCDRVSYHSHAAEGHLSECMAYISKVMRGFIDTIAKDERTSREIFNEYV